MEEYKYSSIKERLKKEYRIYIAAFLIIVISDLIGQHKIPIGPGVLVIFPIFYGLIGGTLLGPDLLKFFKKEESEAASPLVLVAIAPFIVKLGIMAGGNLSQLASMGPALLLQELGNLGTIFISLPLAMMLGLKREAVGATHSINRETNLALISNVYGPDSDEMRGTLSIYIIGGALGTIFFGFLATLVASIGLFHPFALAMASGAGSGIMMASAATSLSHIYPEYADKIVMLAGASNTLTGITGIYASLFLALPLANKLYSILDPVINKKREEETYEK
ncbi:protein of unknown function DUF3100 [Gottschalkia purinilytica]|uniref:DUF3100 domain-containing protein n=1 Tax=Gottschalkia purinilytica TaxID=1503 RepID=A0A0L0W801_GOTPU|nr:DUF3100 domain-containing protein [Gottschalkia purinilytica]KNF07566.1 protein of unknown function DUF3100 [Gottschalkia purinilytica]